MDSFQEKFQELDRLQATPLSYSKGTTAIVCPLQYKHRYMSEYKGGTPLVTTPAAIGKFVHNVLQYCVEKGMSYGFTLEDIDFDYTWHDTSKRSGLTLAEYNTAQAMRENTRNILRRILNVIASRDLHPTPEMKLSLTKAMEVRALAPKSNKWFYGLADLVCLTPKRNRALLIDYKTHSETEERALAVDRQTKIYSRLLFWRYSELQVVQSGCAYIPDETIQLTEHSREDSVLDDTLTSFLDDVISSLSAPELLPKKSKYCDWCNYIHDCPLHTRKKRKA